MKLRMFSFFLLTALIFCFFLPHTAAAEANANNPEDSYGFSQTPDFETESNNVILIDAESGETVYSKNPDEITYIASLTKIMTAITVIENVGDLDETVTIEKEDLEKIEELDLFSLNMTEGQIYSYRDLLYCLCMASAADAGFALARSVGGSVDEFCDMMNQKAEELGLEDTHFSNPIGYDDEQNYSTVRQVSKLFSYALQNETLYRMFGSEEYVTTENSVSVKSTLTSLFKRYGKTLGYIRESKTGSTEKAGMCLACLGVNRTRKYIFVCAGNKYGKTPHNISDAEKVLGFYLFCPVKKLLLKKDTFICEIPVSGKNEKAVITTQEDIIRNIYPGTDINGEVSFAYEGVKEITDQSAGEILGRVRVYVGKTLVYTYEVTRPAEDEYISTEVWQRKQNESFFIGVTAKVLICSAFLLAGTALALAVIKKQRPAAPAPKKIIATEENEKTLTKN